LPLEENVVDLLSADSGLEGGLGRRQVDDDVRDVLFEADLLKRLIRRDNLIP
jgi:hypothetical protein